MSHEAVTWALDDAPLLRTERGKADTTARFVLVALAERADKHGKNARPSLVDIQYRTGFDRSTVQRALRRLEAAGLIVRTGAVNGCTCWRLVLDRRRPADDRVALEAEEAAEREKAAERKRRSREKAVTHSAAVTVTHSTPVTDPDVTHFTPGRHALNARDNGDVTHFTPSRHALNAAQTVLEPSVERTTQEPTPPPTAGPPKGAGTDKRGTRLPDDFPVTPEMAGWAREKAPLCGIDDHEAFCDYWRAQPGAKGRKTDWTATWRNWMRREQERRAGRSGPAASAGPRRSTTDERVDQAQALKDELGLTPGGNPKLNLIRGELA